MMTTKCKACHWSKSPRCLLDKKRTPNLAMRTKGSLLPLQKRFKGTTCVITLFIAFILRRLICCNFASSPMLCHSYIKVAGKDAKNSKVMNNKTFGAAYVTTEAKLYSLIAGKIAIAASSETNSDDTTDRESRRINYHIMPSLSFSLIRKTPISVVVSYCHRPLSWLPTYLSDLENVQTITIISKCGALVPSELLKRLKRVDIASQVRVEVFEWNNVGRCDHSFSQWIVDHYDYIYQKATKGKGIQELDPIVLFLKDNQLVHQPGHSCLSVEDLIALAKADGFGCLLSAENGTSIFHDHHQLCQFSIKSYRGYSESFPSDFTNMAQWHDHVLHLSASGVYMDTIVPVCYGGNFAVRQRNIAKIPRDVWLQMKKSLERGDSIEEGHFAERSWALLLHDPITTEMKDYISQKGKIMLSPFYYRGKYFF